MTGACVIEVPIPVASPAAYLVRDLLAQTVGASRLIYSIDLDLERSFPRQATPTNGDVVRNLATDDVPDATIIGVTGANPAFHGGGLDYTGLVPRGAKIQSPAGIVSSLAAAQKYCVGAWIKLPSAAQHTLGQSYMPFLSMIPVGGSYVGTIPAMLELAFFSSGSNPAVFCGRQSGSGTSKTLIHTRPSPAVWPYGEVALVCAYRTATQTGLLMRTDGATTIITSGDVTANSLTDWSGIRMQFGANFSSGAFGFSAYRAWVVDLSGNGAPDPIDVANADWDGYRGFYS